MLMTAVAALVSGATVQAVPINGAITFAGGVQLDTTSVNTATKVIAGGWANPYVQSDSGSFSGIPTLIGGLVTITSPWSFNSGAMAGFWTVSGFTFDLISSSIVHQGSGLLGVTGTGTISGNGYTPTLGTWTFTTSDPGAGQPLVFSFQAANGAVPDGGMTVIMLGAALSGLGLLRKKLTA